MRAYIIDEQLRTIQIGLTVYRDGVKEHKAKHRSKDIKALRCYLVKKNDSKTAQALMDKYIKEDRPETMFSSVKRKTKFTRS